MVVCSADHGLQADVIFVIEGTAVTGAYINDLKTNYIIPSLEYFNQGNIEETNYVSESNNSYYGIVIFNSADCLPHPSTDTIGPFSSASKLLTAVDKLELTGGKGESHANIAEGLATALQCFEELQQKRESSSSIQKHCILICNSPPYSLPVLECHAYSGNTAEQLAAVLLENNINLSVISPRKIPLLYKLFEKAGGDLTASQTKNYAKDPRHLVLLKGFSLKERPLSPPPGSVSSTQSLQSSTLPITSLPSPIAGNDSPIQGSSQAASNILGNNGNSGVGVPQSVGQNPVYRPPTAQGIPQLPSHNQGLVPNQKGVVVGGRMLPNAQMPPIPQMNAPPYHTAGAGQVNRSSPHWPMPPPTQQTRPYMPHGQVNTTQGASALITQLTQPPASISATGVQFPQNEYVVVNNQNSPINKINMGQQPNVQTSMPQNQSSIQTSMPQSSQPNQVVTSQAQSTVQSSVGGTGRERNTIWQGLLEWIEKPKNAPDAQKITKHVPCQVSANCKDGEPELKADGWPQKLIMQLMPKQLIGNIGGAYLKNSKSVLFHPQPCDALQSLTNVMSSGFAGCVHFTSIPNPAACDIKVLILLYTTDKRAYLGFIPNDQAAFVDRLRKVIQQQKSTQQMRQAQGGTGGPTLNQTIGPSFALAGTPPGTGGNTVTPQSTQQGLIMSQTNTLSMGGGQITQNVVTSTGQQGNTVGGIMGQNVSGPNMRPNIRMQGIQPGNNQQALQPGIMGAPVQRAPFENFLQVERQQNLEKINQLKQTLEAAQQQEQQYKSQLERISHMKTSQLQEALMSAQQTELQFKMLDQQRMANQGAQSVNAQQQQQRSTMRPVMANNPGLRHLLQQQPQYRQQVMGMAQMGGNGPRPQMGQQMPNTGTTQQSSFEDVSNFDFNIM